MLTPPPSQAMKFDANDTHAPVANVPNETLLTVFWRHRWLISGFLIAGLLVGYWVSLQKPTTYRATNQLLFKSDSPLSLDSTTGVLHGGIPSGNLMQSLITSDAIIDRVVASAEIRGVPSLQAKSDEQIENVIRDGIQFQTITDRKDSRDRMIAAIHFDGRDPLLCVSAVGAVTHAIGQHFDAERESTINEFSRLINNAQSKLLPQQAALEQEYKRFRETAPLEWDLEGQAVNPHRERQFALQNRRLEIEQRYRELGSELRFAKSTVDRHNDPLLIAQIIGQLSGVVDEFSAIREVTSPTHHSATDLELQSLEVEKALVPLKIKREQLEAAYGPSHPEVKSITLQIEHSLRELGELNRLMAARHAELDAETDDVTPGDQSRRMRIAHAKEAIDAYLQGLSERLLVMDSDLEELDQQIAAEKLAADELKKAEDNDASYRRRIESIKGMLIQLEQQLAALKLVDINGGIIVDPLLDSGKAYVTGPDLTKDLLVYAMAALVVSGLIAILIDASAKMFRSADEIQQELLLPVLAHVPLDESPAPQTGGRNGGEVTRLDPKLAVVHRPYSPAAEAIRGIRTAILFDSRSHGSKVFQITSPLPGDGKSTLAANVACSLAQTGKKTLLLDLDLRSPRLSLRFDLDADRGVTNVLNGECELSEAVHDSKVANLDILPCGPLPANPAEALTLSELGDVFDWARSNYDFVIVDTPPLLMVSDPSIVTTHIDAAMMVIRVRRRSKPNSKEAVSILRASGARIAGVIVNKLDELSSGSLYKSSASGSYQAIGYGYGDQYRERYREETNLRDSYVVKGRTPVAAPSSIILPGDTTPSQPV